MPECEIAIGNFGGKGLHPTENDDDEDLVQRQVGSVPLYTHSNYTNLIMSTNSTDDIPDLKRFDGELLSSSTSVLMLAEDKAVSPLSCSCSDTRMSRRRRYREHRADVHVPLTAVRKDILSIMRQPEVRSASITCSFLLCPMTDHLATANSTTMVQLDQY